MGVTRRQFLLAAGGVCGLASLGSCAYRSGPESDLGQAVSGEFHSSARHCSVGWTISYPPGHKSGDRLPLVLALHPYTGNHVFPVGDVTPVRLLAQRRSGHPMPAVAVAAADGGNGYWHAHPGDDPMAMLLHEFLPMCRDRGLGVGSAIGVIGASMGGYGALLLAEKNRGLVMAIGAVSPAIWITYAGAAAANPTAFTGAADFAVNDVITHSREVYGVAIHVASGAQDPFHPGVEALADVLPRSDSVHFPPGGHDDAFFTAHAPEALWFVGRRLTQVPADRS